MFFYHGSLEDIKDEYLKPHVAFSTYETYKKEPAVFLTISEISALLHARNPIRIYAKEQNSIERCNAFSSYFSMKDGVIHIYECYEGMFKESLMGPAYLYVCEIENLDNEQDDLYNYKYFKPLKYGKKIFIENVLEYIEKFQDKVKLHRFEDLTDLEKYNLYEHVGIRANSCESEIEVRFFKEKFSNIFAIQDEILLIK